MCPSKPDDRSKSDQAGDSKTPADVRHPNRIVTLEEHFFDLSLVEGDPVTKQAAAWHPRRDKAQLGDLGDGRLRDMDAHGIIVQVISASAPGADLFDGEEAVPKPIFDAYYAGLSEEASQVLSGAGYGWHAEVAVHIFRMAFAGTFEKHPGLNVIVGHMGETLPFALDRMDHTLG